MTVHDISHLDALWDTASAVAEGAVNINPAEAFVLGAGILLHDAAMSLAAYPGGLAEVKTTMAWKDAVARLALAIEENTGSAFDVTDPPIEITQRVVPDVLRRLHAERAEELAEQFWIAADGSHVHIIDDADLRHFYGPAIGQIAHSHWWSVHRIEEEFSEDLGALANRTLNRVDRIKLACLLRVADALHLDSRRAPRFLRAITNPTGISALHWAFQERLARPHIELDAVVFTTGQPFGREDAEAWWLAHDTLNAVDRELRDVDLLLQGRGREVLKARRVKGAGSPEMLARSVQTKGWRPVDARLQVSDVPRIVENLGGSKLYGNDPTVPLRELIQNSADAVQARRRFQNRPANWGLITVGLAYEGDDVWLTVEDNGIGMSEHVLTGPLLDFGTSFWRSPQAMEEFPGLMAAGMHAIGRFGIGFFSVFMLGTVVRVYSRRCDRGQDSGRLLEFRGGTSARPILSPCPAQPVPIDGGTRVEVLLKTAPAKAGGLLHINSWTDASMSIEALVASLAPNLDVALATVVQDDAEPIVKPGDWLKITDVELAQRLNPTSSASDLATSKANRTLMQPIVSDDGQVFGRAYIMPQRFSFSSKGGGVTISGLRAARLSNVEGILLGEAVTAARDAAQPIATASALARWASEQAELVATSVKDEERQARTAEVVLECGGDIGNLKLVRWGEDWLSSREFEERLGTATMLTLSFDGEFSYDEDSDRVHPKEFREDFQISKDAIVVLKHDGEILKSTPTSWPRSLTGAPKWNLSNLALHVRALIEKVWGEDLHEVEEEDWVVGDVAGTEILRKVTVIKRASSSPFDFDDEVA
jgi:hypothetical protein